MRGLVQCSDGNKAKSPTTEGCPDDRVVNGVAIDCSVALNTAWVRIPAGACGKVAKFQIPIKGYTDGRVV